MDSIKQIYKTGMGPSSSHTMGPKLAAETFRRKTPAAARYRIGLYGSLALTGAGHLTDKAIIAGLGGAPAEIEWNPAKQLPLHPNGMEFSALDENGSLLDRWQAYSVGGGEVRGAENFRQDVETVYPHKNFSEIRAYIEEKGITLWKYAEEHEGPELWDYLAEVWTAMRRTLIRGIREEDMLPGGLRLQRKAYSFLTKAKTQTQFLQPVNFLFAYALGCAEENAAGGEVVTAPTCGSCGVVPALLHLMQTTYDFSDKRIHHALATAGIFGNVARHNASISGAEVGCQGEIGVACAMASGATAQLLAGSIAQIEYAAEAGLEHHLGLTCDPVRGLVQVPCIERNAMAAVRALSCSTYALLSDGHGLVSYDDVVSTMHETGLDMNAKYRETATGGLARILNKKYGGAA
ncbi:MAG: L-serine ammonia-lyase [Elusimicrobiaceae bacterium]|nr:L-serine ammonia-lyase [Elusimicrobiaceae bacterium]